MCSSETLVSAEKVIRLSSPSGMCTESVASQDNGSSMASTNSIVQPIDHYRLQLYNYALQAERLRFVQNYAPSLVGNSICPTAAFSPYSPRWPFPISLFQARLNHEEPKPQHSYIGLIAMAILSSPETKLVLSDIYQYILDNYPYFRSRGPGWRNSIRHNLSLNDCFIKAGRSANGKGHYWAIHPANVDDFKKGDFRRRKAQRKVRKHMGLAVDDDGNESPSPPPLTPPPTLWPSAPIVFPPTFASNVSRKRQFDVASLLAPDDNTATKKQKMHQSSSSGEENEPVDIDVVTSTESNVPNSQQPLNCLPSMSSWCYPNALHTSLPQHQQLVAKYYEHLNHARTIHLYQQLQMQRRFCGSDLTNSDHSKIEEDVDSSG